ncbi:MAG TPA: methyltransferase domain-containing protein [Actinomycetota bacterium]|nr:methyltransferase domain-containing protein [Actinomycetota bacterium]
MTSAETITEAALEDRLISSATAALEVYSIHLGRRLGLYRALAEEPRTAGQLAEAAGIHPRYAREWLEQQAVAGFLSVDNQDADAEERVYRLDSPSAAVFTAEEDVRHVSPLADIVAGIGMTLDKVAAAYRDGSGVSFGDYGPHLMAGQGAINRPAFMQDLVGSWIGAVDGLLDRLRDGGRIADLGCGVGWGAIAMALQIPGATVIGWDADSGSIEAARRNAETAGANVRFELANASALEKEGPFELVTILEALHDMSNPVQVLRAAGSVLAEGGLVLVADEKVADRFTAPGDELERMMYGWSITHCLPAAMADQPSAGLGTVLRAPMVQELGEAAGFRSVETLDVDAGFFQLHILRK